MIDIQDNTNRILKLIFEEKHSIVNIIGTRGSGKTHLLSELAFQCMLTVPLTFFITPTIGSLYLSQHILTERLRYCPLEWQTNSSKRDMFYLYYSRLEFKTFQYMERYRFDGNTPNIVLIDEVDHLSVQTYSNLMTLKATNTIIITTSSGRKIPDPLIGFGKFII